MEGMPKLVFVTSYLYDLTPSIRNTIKGIIYGKRGLVFEMRYMIDRSVRATQA